MSDRYYRRLRRYAVFSTAQVAAVVVAVVPGIDASAAATVFLVLTVPVMWAWGHFQAHVAFNGLLDDVARLRWRIALAAVPGAQVVYWKRFVRPRMSANSRLRIERPG